MIVLTFSTAPPGHAQDAASRAAVASALQAKISSFTPLVAPSPPDIAALREFYASRGNAPVWVDERGPTRAAHTILNIFKNAANWGLDSEAYATPAASAPLVSGRWTPDLEAAAEFEISTLVLKYASDARGGRIADPERMLSTYLDRHPVLPAPANVISSVAGAENPEKVLLSFHPQHAQFRLLQSAYAKLRSAAALDPAAIIPRDGPMLTPGMQHPDVAALRLRLNVPGTADAKDATTYDRNLVAAVKRFQDGAGLNDDGLVGNATRKALTDTNVSKLATMRANLEQWRWMPADLGSHTSVRQYSQLLDRHDARRGAPAARTGHYRQKRNADAGLLEDPNHHRSAANLENAR